MFFTPSKEVGFARAAGLCHDLSCLMHSAMHSQKRTVTARLGGNL